jgi:hypothetical protein
MMREGSDEDAEGLDDFGFVPKRGIKRQPAADPGVFETECGWVAQLCVRYGSIQIYSSKKESYLRFIVAPDM